MSGMPGMIARSISSIGTGRRWTLVQPTRSNTAVAAIARLVAVAKRPFIRSAPQYRISQGTVRTLNVEKRRKGEKERAGGKSEIRNSKSEIDVGWVVAFSPFPLFSSAPFHWKRSNVLTCNV
jgi:hypothetical protein